MSALNRYGAKGQFVEGLRGKTKQAVVLWDAMPDGRNSECWVEIRHDGRVIDVLRGLRPWGLEQARDAAKANALAG